MGFWIIGTGYNRFSALFLVAIGIAFGTLLLMVMEKGGHGKKHAGATVTGKHNKVVWSILIIPVLVLFLNSLTQSAIVSFLALFAISMNLVGIGSFFSINAVGMIASRFVMTRLVRRFGEFQMILVNTVVFAASVFLLTQAKSLPLMLLLAFPAGFAMGSIAPIVNTHIIQHMPDHKKGLANALYFSTLDIGYGLGSVVWGMIAMATGYVQVFFLAAFLQVVSIVLVLIRLTASRKKRTRSQDSSASSGGMTPDGLGKETSRAESMNAQVEEKTA